MIRVLYHWDVKPESSERFVAWWSEGTARIRAEAPGALGSVLMRPQIGTRWSALARWQSFDDWVAFRASLPPSHHAASPWPLASAEPFDEVEDQTVC